MLRLEATKNLFLSQLHYLFDVLQNNHESRESTKEFLPEILCSSSLTFLSPEVSIFSNSLWEYKWKGVQAHCVHLSHCLFQSQEELQEYCRHHEITYVALVSDKEGSHVKVKIVSWRCVSGAKSLPCLGETLENYTLTHL